MIEFRHLRAFVAVAEELNFRRAAARIGIVQPALSRTLRDLEDHLGLMLITRNTRAVSVTPAGRVFLDEARALLQSLSRAVTAARNAAQGRTGEITLAYMDFAVHRLVLQLLARLKARAPGICVTLSYMPTALQRNALIQNEIDAGLLIGPVSSPRIESRAVAEDPITVALPAAHPLCAKPVLSMCDLIGEPLVLGSPVEWSAFRAILFALYAKENAVPVIAQEASSAAALFGLVAAGLGLTFYAGEPSRYASADIAIRPLANAPLVPIVLAWNRDNKPELMAQLVAAVDVLAAD